LHADSAKRFRSDVIMSINSHDGAASTSESLSDQSSSAPVSLVEDAAR
jgi:hypothetical protein